VRFLLQALLTLGLALAASLPAAAQPAPVWAQLTADQQEVLRALQPRWDQLPEFQRARLLGAAKRYASLSPQQQRRFSKRLATWASLTPAQRNQARAAYRSYSRMSKDEQLGVRKRWFAQHPNDELATTKRAN
jgi:hypothetical protein